MKVYLKGKIDAVFLCHGVVVELNLANCSTPDFDQTLLVNVRSNVHLMSLSFPFLKQNEHSSITLLTSSACNSPDPRASVMSISSAMVKQLV